MLITLAQGSSAGSIEASNLTSWAWKFDLAEGSITSTLPIRADVRQVSRALDTSIASGFSALVDWRTVAIAIKAFIWGGNRASILCKTVSWVLNTFVIRALEAESGIL